MSTAINAASVFHAQTYTGYVPQEGDVMRCLGFKNGFLELARVDRAVLTHQDVLVEKENIKIESLDLRGVKRESVARNSLLAGTSAACSIEIEDTDDEEEEGTNNGKCDDEEENIPLAHVVSRNSVRSVVLPSRTAPIPSLSSSTASRMQPRRAGKPTKDEKLDMSVYIFSKGPSVDMEYPAAWTEFRKLKDHKRRQTSTWAKIYRNNKGEIEGRVGEMRSAQRSVQTVLSRNNA